MRGTILFAGESDYAIPICSTFVFMMRHTHYQVPTCCRVFDGYTAFFLVLVHSEFYKKLLS